MPAVLSRRDFRGFWRPRRAEAPRVRPAAAPADRAASVAADRVNPFATAPASCPPASAPAMTSTSEPLRLPPLQQTLLDVATTDALFRDLALCAQVQSVTPKYARDARTGPETLTLEQARVRLAAGLLLGVQIRYAYDGHAWTDTLLRRPAGLTLVRIREADVAASIGPGAPSV